MTDEKQRPKKDMPVSPGRPKGVPNKTTQRLQEAILLAAEEHGDDDKGNDGLKGYCRHLARIEPKSFAALLGKVLPLQVTGEGGGSIKSEVKVKLTFV